MARLKVSIVFESGARSGPGKAALLESIRDTGSISAAARDMGMSYKCAWLLLDSMNQAFTEPVVTAAPGGAGGGATLTPFGAEVLERYRRINDRAAATADDDIAALARRARPEAGPKSEKQGAVIARTFLRKCAIVKLPHLYYPVHPGNVG
jgi:molybdate transport system regulatory protein